MNPFRLLWLAPLVLGSILSSTQPSPALAADARATQKSDEGAFRFGRKGETEGKDLYEVYCSSCHGLTGKGEGKASSSLSQPLKPLQDIYRDKKRRERELIEVIKEGKGQMPGWGHVLSDAQVREIHRYIERELVKEKK